MRFENRKYPHNKWYEIEVQPGPDDTYRLYTSWGPIGSTMTKHKVIYEGEIQGAMKEFAAVRKKRIKNGYTQVD